jgi:hypothetical protein
MFPLQSEVINLNANEAQKTSSTIEAQKSLASQNTIKSE